MSKERVEIELPGKAEDVIGVLKAENCNKVVYLYDEGCSTPLGWGFLERRNGNVVVCGESDAAVAYFHSYCSVAGLDAEPIIETPKTALELTASRQ